MASSISRAVVVVRVAGCVLALVGCSKRAAPVADAPVDAAPPEIAEVRGAVDVAAGPTTCVRARDGAVACGEEVVAVNAALAGAKQIALGPAHTCARTADDGAVCWGANAHGELGDATQVARKAPTPVSGLTNVAELALGDGFSLARLGDGTVKSWGRNDLGQLGDATKGDRPRVGLILGLAGVQQIAAGAAFACARLGDGTVRCWGRNDRRQLGEAADAPARARSAGDRRSVPVAIAGLTGVAQIAVGAAHACAVGSDGSVRCWGAGDRGQIGVKEDRATPFALAKLGAVAEVAAGAAHTCARRYRGDVVCWGANDAGQLGDGTTTDRDAPVVASGLADAVQLAAGPTHTCARLASGAVRCWGKGFGAAPAPLRAAP